MAKRARRRRKAESAAKRSSAPPPPPPDFFSENWRAIAAIAIVLILTIVVVWAVTQADWGDDDEPNGKVVAPAFSLFDVDNLHFELALQKGKVVVLDLFATWCIPCRDQMEALNELRLHYPEWLVVMISVDVDPLEGAQLVRDFRDEYSASWTFALDSDNLTTKYNADQVPTLAIIDRDGNLVWTHQGTTSFEDLKLLIDPLIESS